MHVQKKKTNADSTYVSTVPPSFDWDQVTQQRIDRWDRAELNYGCVDYVASPDFMSRPPQPPVYVFVIDTSLEAIQSGMIEVLAEALTTSLDKIPNHEGRTRVGFITVNQTIGFYGLNNKLPELLMMSEIDDIYLPRPYDDLVVNLSEAKAVVLDLLERLKSMFKMTAQTYVTTNNNNCLGAALKAARHLLVRKLHTLCSSHVLTFFFFSIFETVAYRRKNCLLPSKFTQYGDWRTEAIEKAIIIKR